MRIESNLYGIVRVRVRWRDLWRLIMDGWVSADNVKLELGE